jgi:hypothetical protein
VVVRIGDNDAESNGGPHYLGNASHPKQHQHRTIT